MRILLCAAIALTLSGVAYAQTEPAPQSAPPAQEQPAEASQPDDAVQCRSYRVTGSRLSVQRICRTRSEWQQEAERARALSDDINRRALQQCIPNASGSCGG
ncbi:MAG: hypothetical protein K2P58_00350 [Hyphomonadaceae bacterium]|nr:hypothetical protein [Hyphomonadaceae bacterium]